MKIYELTSGHWFPNPQGGPGDMPLAIGGDLHPDRLIKAYQMGIFPWFNQEDPILWWSPNPRMVLYPEAIQVSKSMRKVIREGQFTLTFDQAFAEVIGACQKIPRKDQDGTWISTDIIDAYTELHHRGLAHSAEVWQDGELVGGLYGVSLGGSFFGESMFSKVSNASKFAFIQLAQKLFDKGFDLIDCQVHTDHLESLGAVTVDRGLFLSQLSTSLKKSTLEGNWNDLFTP